MVAHRVDIGSVVDPLQAGNPLRLNVVARTSSGQPAGSYGVTDLTGMHLDYALFALDGDLPVATPSFTLASGLGITVTSATGGAFSILLSSNTTLWSGRDWHACRVTDIAGQPFDLFDGFVVSTRALNY
jgi:hypothetical protein